MRVLTNKKALHLILLNCIILYDNEKNLVFVETLKHKTNHQFNISGVKRKIIKHCFQVVYFY